VWHQANLALTGPYLVPSDTDFELIRQRTHLFEEYKTLIASLGKSGESIFTERPHPHPPLPTAYARRGGVKQNTVTSGVLKSLSFGRGI
jgi:hypothetical protein